MNVKVELKGAEDVKRGLSDLLGRTEAIKQEVFFSSLEVQRVAKDNVRDVQRIDTGNLRNSILVETKDAGLTGEIGPVAPYGIYVEFGTRPHFPPPDALEDWAHHHGFDSAWPVCLAIAKHGMSPRPYLTPAFNDVEPKFEERLRRIFE